MDMNSILREFVQEREVPIFGIASVDGFDQALPGWHPKELMPRCKSVIVFGLPFVGAPWHVDEETYIIDHAWFAANEPVYRTLPEWRGGLVNLFDAYGVGVASFGGFWISAEPTMSYRLAQYEAGVGVFGRFGVCISPDFGCYYCVGVLLTEAELTPTGRDRLAGFDPCDGCTLCTEVCPTNAIDGSKPPAEGYDMVRCFRFLLRLRQRYEADSVYRYEDVKFCGRCFGVCPWAYTNATA